MDCMYCKHSEDKHKKEVGGGGGHCPDYDLSGQRKGWFLTSFRVCQHSVTAQYMNKSRGKHTKCKACGAVLSQHEEKEKVT